MERPLRNLKVKSVRNNFFADTFKMELGFRQYILDEEGKCEIGYELLTNFQGQGIMQEAAEKVVDYAFNTIKVQKIEAIFHRYNQRSINLLEKLLFRN